MGSNRTAKRTLARVLTILFSIVVTLQWGTSAHSSNQHDSQGQPRWVKGRVLVKFSPRTTSSRAAEIMSEYGAFSEDQIESIGIHMLRLPPGLGEEAAARALGSRPEVDFAEPDRLVEPDYVPNDPYFPSQWHLARIAAPAAWDSTIGSRTVIVAILDTGVDSTHPDLAPNIVLGWNFYDNNANTADVYGHGTAVAGTVAAAGNNGAGVASVAWTCSIMPVRISDPTGYATYSMVASGMTWAADHGARVANVSYMMTDSSTVTSAAKYFQDKGGVVAMSAGNYSTFDPSADNPYILTVGASDTNDAFASFSNYGNNIDLVAPGVSIYTTSNGGSYGGWSGTSFSAPITAGVAALVISANPALRGAQVQNILKSTADDRGNPGWDSYYGYGRVNAARAVSAALSAVVTAPPTVSITSPAPGSTVSGKVSIQVSATSPVGIASVALAVDGVATVTDTSAPYVFSWDTTTAANAMHVLTATAMDTAGIAGNASITVTVYNAADTMPPSISIKSPTDGATVSGNVTVTVGVTDNVSVTRVQLYVDGSLKTTSTTAPFTTKWNSNGKVAKGAHTLQCKAYDAAGNVGVSSIVTIHK